MEASGWAIVQDGHIDIRTVSAHPRAAKVNWLVTTARLMVYNSWTDELIESFWQKLSKDHEFKPKCVEVLITVKE